MATYHVWTMGNGTYGNATISKMEIRDVPGRHIGYAYSKKEISQVIAEFEAEEAKQQTPEYLVPLLNAALKGYWQVWRTGTKEKDLLESFLQDGIASDRPYTLQEVEEKYYCIYNGHNFTIKEVTK